MPGYHQGRPPKNKGLRFVGPATRRGDHRRHARHRERCGRRPPASADRRPLASRAADQRSARPRRDRPRPLPRRRHGARWEGRTASGGGHGPVGVGPIDRLPRGPRGPAGRHSVLRAAWPHRREALGGLAERDCPPSPPQRRRRREDDVCTAWTAAQIRVAEQQFRAPATPRHVPACGRAGSAVSQATAARQD
jgi:hypothetical protein